MKAMLSGFWVHCSECSKQLAFDNPLINEGQPFPKEFRVKCSNPSCKEFDKLYRLQCPAMDLRPVA